MIKVKLLCDGGYTDLKPAVGLKFYAHDKTQGACAIDICDLEAVGCSVLRECDNPFGLHDCSDDSTTLTFLKEEVEVVDA
jgi:hypothetical protein